MQTSGVLCIFLPVSIPLVLQPFRSCRCGEGEHAGALRSSHHRQIIAVRSEAASYLNLHVRTVLSVRLPLFFFFLSVAPQRSCQSSGSRVGALRRQALCWRLSPSDLGPTCIQSGGFSFVRPEQTKTLHLNRFKLSRNKNDLPGLFQVLYCSKLLPFSLLRSYFS